MNRNLEYETFYIQEQDLSVIFEYTENRIGERERIRICGMYFGKPEKELTETYKYKGIDVDLCESCLSAEEISKRKYLMTWDEIPDVGIYTLDMFTNDAGFDDEDRLHIHSLDINEKCRLDNVVIQRLQ